MADPAEALSVVIEDDAGDVRVDPATGTIEVPQDDGGVVVHLNAQPAQKEQEGDAFDANLALTVPAERLTGIATDLHDAVSADNRSRQDSLAIYEKALGLMGLKLEETRTSVDSSTGVDGLSAITNPLMLEAVLKGWANAQAELLPASGPVKIQDDGDESDAENELADALERDMNHYLTATATEYYPDTSHMLLWGTHLAGSGFKKVYRCPLRRRPVSESVAAKDLIVSDTMKDLRSCGRITHQISMRPSLMRRMIFAKAYRDVPLAQPTSQPDGVDDKIAGIQGTLARATRPEDQPYTVWEIQCELDLDEFAPKDFKGEGIALPYIVTLDKDSHDILALRRDWDEDDTECTRRRMYVRYPYVPGPGFYGTGLLNILGNCSAAMTQSWRLALDAGMFANFPAGLMSKDASRQNSNIQRIAPGEFAPLETGGKDIRTIVMGMPYKDVTPGLLALMDKITAQAQSVGSAADIPAGEGIQNVPVGTMLARIEQATKIMAAAHKGMHGAQAEEIELFVELFRQNPQDFWRNRNRASPPDYWSEEKFAEAVQNCKLVPVSDPNVPSHIHRIARAMALVDLSVHPVIGPRLNPDEVTARALRAMREDPRGLQIEVAPSAAPPDPKLIEAAARAKGAEADATLKEAKAAQVPADSKNEADKIQATRDIAASNLEREHLIHDADGVRAARKDAIDQGAQTLSAVKTAHEIATARGDQHLEAVRTGHDIAQGHHDRRMDEAGHALDVHQALNPPAPPPKSKP